MQCSSPVQRSATGTCQGEAGQLASLSHAAGWAPCHGWFWWDLFDIMSHVGCLFGFRLLSNLSRSQASFLQCSKLGLESNTRTLSCKQCKASQQEGQYQASDPKQAGALTNVIADNCQPFARQLPTVCYLA